MESHKNKRKIKGFNDSPNTRIIKGIVNWMIPKDSDEGMFYAHTLAVNATEYEREAKVVSATDISIPPKIIVKEVIKLKQKDLLKNHHEFIANHMRGPKPDN